jgi:ferritin
VEQVGHELTAHQDYMGMALYFLKQAAFAGAGFFRGQAIEEAQHATRIMDFLIDNEVQPDVPPLSGATSQFESGPARSRRASTGPAASHWRGRR